MNDGAIARPGSPMALRLVPIFTAPILARAWAAALAIAVAFAAPAARAATLEEKYERQYKVAGEATISIDGFNGEIVIEAGDDDLVSVKCVKYASNIVGVGLREALDQIEVALTRNGDIIILSGRTKGSPGLGTSWGVNFYVRAPKASVIRAQTSNGRIKARGIEGRLNLITSNGAMEIGDCGGEVKALTTNGRIEARNAQGGRFTLETTNGKIHLDGRASETNARTTNGNIDLVLAPDASSAVWAVSTNGSIAFSGMAGPQCNLLTNDGRVTLLLHPASGFHIEAASANGRVISNFPLEQVHESGSRYLRGETGPAPRGAIQARSDNGDVQVLPAKP